MTRFIHDQFAKEFLKKLLTPLGEVTINRTVRGEVRAIDVWFTPAEQTSIDRSILGLLGQITLTPCLFEPFRNPASINEVRNCLLKLLEVQGEMQRQTNRNKTPMAETDLPQLCILTPTASTSILEGFGAKIEPENSLEGVYTLAQYLRTKIVVIHQLPKTHDTLWLRVLGRGKIQEQAIDEIGALPFDHPFRAGALELLLNLLATIENTERFNQEDRELIMKLSTLYSDKLAEATRTATEQGLQQGVQQGLQQGVQQGLQQGLQQGERIVIENLLKVRFGSLDSQLERIITPLLELPAEEFTPLLLQLSRDELLARFSSTGEREIEG